MVLCYLLVHQYKKPIYLKIFIFETHNLNLDIGTYGQNSNILLCFITNSARIKYKMVDTEFFVFRAELLMLKDNSKILFRGELQASVRKCTSKVC